MNFLVAARAYFGAMEMLVKTTWEIFAIDFETATATKIPTVRGEAMVKGKGVYRHKGQVLRQMWKQIPLMGEIEEMTRHLTEQASDLMLVGLAKEAGFPTGVKLRCKMKVADFSTEWLQGTTWRTSRDGELHMSREGPGDKKKKRNTPKTETLMKCEELRRKHLWKQVMFFVGSGTERCPHVTQASDKYGVTKCMCCGRESLTDRLPTVL